MELLVLADQKDLLVRLVDLVRGGNPVILDATEELVSLAVPAILAL